MTTPRENVINLVQDARKCQVLYRTYLDTPAMITGNDELWAFIDTTLDLLERITGESIPASATFPEVHDHFVGDDHG